MRFTTQAEYGLICTLHLARFGAMGPVAAREMAEKEELPADYTEKILRRLRQAGIVNSVRGVSGGFELARDASEISVKDVIEATEGSTSPGNSHPVIVPFSRRRRVRVLVSIPVTAGMDSSRSHSLSERVAA